MDGEKFLSKLDNMGDRITFFRKGKSLGVEELAALVGVDRRTIYAWESNEKRPRQKRIDRLAEIFDIKPQLLDPTIPVGSNVIDFPSLQEDAHRNAHKLVLSVMALYGYPENTRPSKWIMNALGITPTEENDAYIFFGGNDPERLSMDNLIAVKTSWLSLFYEELIDYVEMRMKHQSGRDLQLLRARKIFAESYVKYDEANSAGDAEGDHMATIRKEEE